MRRWRMKMEKLSAFQLAMILLIFGLILGILIANIFREFYQDQMTEYQTAIFAVISRSKIDYSGLFLFTLKNNFKEFLIFWILCTTILGIPYIAYKILAFGFSAGYFISAVTMHYGFKGILLVLAYHFPHGIIYLPLSIFCLYKGFALCRAVNYDKHNIFGKLSHHLKQYVPLIIVLSVILIVASFLEAYVGSFFLKKTLRFFM